MDPENRTLLCCHPEKNSKPRIFAISAKTEAEALQLIEAGFEYVCDIGDAKIFRKRK